MEEEEAYQDMVLKRNLRCEKAYRVFRGLQANQWGWMNKMRK